MEKLQKFLQSMYGLSDDKIPQIAGKFFEELIKVLPVEDCINLRRRFSDIPLDYTMWKEIKEIGQNFKATLGNTKKDSNALSDSRAQLLNEFLRLAETRNKILYKASIMARKEAMPYCLAMTNLDPPGIRRKLDYFWNDFEQGKYQSPALKRSHRDRLIDGFDIDIVQKEIAKISENIYLIGFPGDDHIDQFRIELEAFEVMVLLYNQSRYDKLMATKRLHPSRLNALNDFERCAFCWRFIPKSRTANNKIPYCDFHNPDPKSKSTQTGYMRARELPCNSPELGYLLPDETTEILKNCIALFL